MIQEEKRRMAAANILDKGEGSEALKAEHGLLDIHQRRNVGIR